MSYNIIITSYNLCQYDCSNGVTGILAQETQLLHGEKSPHWQRSKDGMGWDGWKEGNPSFQIKMLDIEQIP